MSPQSMRDAVVKSSRERIDAVDAETAAKEEPFEKCSSRSSSRRERESK